MLNQTQQCKTDRKKFKFVPIKTKRTMLNGFKYKMKSIQDPDNESVIFSFRIFPPNKI